MFKTYTRRFYILGVYCCLTFINAIAWISMAPISSIVKKTYNVTDFEVNMVSLLYLIMFFPGLICATYIFDKYNFRAGILFGATLQAIGAIIKVFINQGFWLVFLGQAILGVSQPAILDAPALLSTIWFEDEMKEIVIMVGSNSNTLGVAIGFLYSTFFVSKEDFYDTESAKHDIAFSLWIQAVICVALLIVTLLTFQDKPPSPPSSHAVVEKETNTVQSFKSLSTDFEFVKLSIVFSILYADHMVLSTIIDSIVEDYGFNTDDSGFFGFTNVVAGFISSVMYGFLLKKYNSHKLFNIIICFTTTLTILIFYLSLHTENRLIVAVAYGLFGFASFPSINVCIAYIAEITPSINEATSVGLALCLTDVIGFIVTNMCTKSKEMFEGEQGTLVAIIILVVLTGLGTVLAAFVRDVPKKETFAFRSETSDSAVELSIL